jgi:NAD(P)H-dependent FMN reductase
MAEESAAPDIVVISGSRREGNNTEKALRIALDELERSGKKIEVIRVGDTWCFPLPGDKTGADDGERLREKVLAAKGLLIATPEYHGSISSTLKLIIDNLGFPCTLEGKTVAIMGVAMGPSADNALAHLRHIVTHVGGSVLPVESSVGGVHKKFGEDGACLEPEVEKSIRAVARGLLDYLNGQ